MAIIPYNQTIESIGRTCPLLLSLSQQIQTSRSIINLGDVREKVIVGSLTDMMTTTIMISRRISNGFFKGLVGRAKELVHWNHYLVKEIL